MCAGLQVLDSVSVLAGAGKIALDSTGLGSGDRYMQEGVLGVRRGHFWGEMGWIGPWMGGISSNSSCHILNPTSRVWNLHVLLGFGSAKSMTQVLVAP